MLFIYAARHRSVRSLAQRARRSVAVMTVASLGLLGCVVSDVAVAAPGNSAISVSKTAPASILAGETVGFTLTAANAGTEPEYNTSLRDVLPLGVIYVAGSTTPSDIGEPTVVAAGNGQQTLIWRDAFDLQVGATNKLTFTATVDNTLATGYPVGSTILNTGNGYASTAPRYVPRFDATGAPIANANVQAATSNQTSTTVSALKISKDEPSPESKLLRGVHDQTTVYTVTVTNTSKAATNTTTVTDYLPAQLEFLGCGHVDNSAGVEYPGAPALTATPTVPANCPTPVSVDTVANPPADGSVSYPPGVYTKVVWNLGTLAAGQSVVIKYAVGVPLRQNVLFAGGPSAASGNQTANLDNNTGASTRQNGDALAQKNFVHAAGVYTGPIKAGGTADVVADGSHTVTINDLRVYKSVTPGEFVAGQVATYTLRVDSGEYTDNSAITITDVLPNGICPLDATGNRVLGAPVECNGGAGFAPSLPYQSVDQNSDGTFTMVFQPIPVARDGKTVITYKGRNRSVYTGGDLTGMPPAAGDAFTNRASEQGTTTPVAGTGFTGDLTVRDSTSATQTTSFGSLDKTVGARATPMNCSSATYGTTNPVFAEGDRVCFQISVPFSTTNQTRNAVVTDFLPDNTSYEDGSVTYPASNSVDPAAQIDFNSDNGALSWKLGATQADGSTVVPVGKVFVARFSAIITGPAAGPAPDKPGNIVKLRTANSAGQARSLRDGVDFRIAAAPPVAVLKGVASVNGSPQNPANTDGVTVKEGDAVQFRIDVKNNGTSANSNDVPIDSLTSWDVLPAGITCAQISAISNGGTCTNPGDAAQPSFTGNGTRSAIVFAGAAGSPLAAGSTRSVTYTMTIPAGVSVSSVLTNTAAVRSYTTATDVNTTAPHYPAGNIDTSVPAASYDVPAATDNSNVKLPDVAVTKGVQSAVSETNNVGNEASPQPTTRATIGEQVTYTVTARIPAGSTVYRATFSDPLPPGLTLNSAIGTFRPDAGSAATAALPAGVTFSSAAPPTFTFPTTYDNTGDTDQVFTMTIVATLAQVAGNRNGVVHVNTASFVSTTGAASATSVGSRTAQATVTDVEPQPALTKTNNAPATGASGGDSITFTLTPSNAAGRPPLHDAWLLDCLPNGLTFGAYGTLPSGVTTAASVAGNGTNGCATGSTVLSWNLGDLAGGQSRVITYTASVDTTSAGKSTLTNVASVSGNSLAGARTGPVDPGSPNGRTYSAGANSVVNVSGATAVKTVTPTSAVPGQTVTYRTSAQLPAGVQFYNLSLIDTLPNGVDPNSVTLVTTDCRNADTSPCTPTSATALTPVAGANSTTVIGWLLGDSGTGAQVRTVTVTYTATVSVVSTVAVAGAGLSNSMKIAWDSAPRTAPTSAGASFGQSSVAATATVTVLEPAVSIAKSVTRVHPEPGQTFGYSLVVSNANTSTTSTAYNVVVTDTVPTGVVVDPATITGGGTITGADAVTGGGTITWNLAAPLAKNASTTLTYGAALAQSSSLPNASSLPNTARVTGYDSLATGGRHYTGPSASAIVGPYFPKLTTVKQTPSGTTAYVGEAFPWRVRSTNTGNGTAYQVGAVDQLPPNWAYDTGSARVAVNGTAAVPVEPTIVSSNGVQTLTWTGLGTLPPGAALIIDYTATPKPAVSQAPGVGLSVDQTNTVATSAQDATGAIGNKSGSYGSSPATAAAHIAAADLAVTKTVGSAPTAGGSGTFTIAVANTGPDTAVGPFTVADDFTRPGVSNVRAAGTGWTCTGTSSFTCVTTGTVAKGVALPPITVTYDVASTVTSGTSLTNSATVTARSADTDPTNDAGTATTTVSTSADVAIVKDLSSTEFVAGRSASYSLTVSNVGPSSATGPIVVTDTIPVGTTYVASSGTGWTCTAPVGRTLTCTLAGPLTVGATPDTLIVTVDVDSSRTASVSNTATVGSSTPDPVASNNTSTLTRTPVVRADVSIQKTHTTDPFVAGEPVDYRIDVANAGPSDATGITVTDTLPAGLTYQKFASTDPDWACSATGQRVTCTYSGALPPGSTSFTLTAGLGPNVDVTKPIVNTATVTSDSTDPVPNGNNSDSDDSSVTARADLSVVKTDSGTTKAGNDLTYSLAVRNDGPSDVPGAVTVTDVLPAGLTFGSATGDGWDCDYAAASRLITCTLDAGLPDDTSAPVITINTTVGSGVGASTISNTASVRSDTPEPLDGGKPNTDDDDVVITTEAAVSLTKTLATAAPVTVGTNARFTLVASNAGPSDAANVTVIDRLPANLSYVSFSGTGWACAATGQNITCTRDTIAAGDQAPALTITARVSASTPVTLPAGTATLVNNAEIGSTTPGTSSNPDPVDVPVQAQANLTLAKTATANPVIAGQAMTWRFAVHNDGPSDAAGPLTITDTLPAYQTFVSGSAPWTCTAGPVPATPADRQDVTCTLPSGLADGGDATLLDIVVQVDTSAPAGAVTNSASVSSPTPGEDGTDDGDVTITRTAALKITKTHTGNGTVDGELAFTIGVRNDGPSLADNVVVTDALPTGLDYVSATGTDWTCVEADRSVTCTLAGTLASGAGAAAITLTTTVRATAFPTVTNTAVVKSTNPQLPATSSASDPVTVEPKATLQVTKEHVGMLVVGKDAAYRITVRNAGPTLTPGPVLVSDELPVGLSYVGSAGEGWTCTAMARVVSCRHDAGLAVGESTVLTLTVRVGVAAFPSVTNTATATANGADPVSAKDTAPVTPTTLLTITKSVTSVRDQVAVYAIAVTDDGPSPTTAPIVVTDPLPAGLRFTSATGRGWVCAAVAGDVTCTYAASLAAGQTATITLTAAITARPGERITNVAYVDGLGTAPDTTSRPATLVVPSGIANDDDSRDGGTADTGVEVKAQLALAGLLLLLGLTVLAAARRRRQE